MVPGKGPGRHKTPAVLQMEAVECGAASLCMVLAYHGRHTPLSELRELCGVNRDGSKASNMIKAARSQGLTARGFRRPAAQALEQTAMPCVAFWRNSHFLVLEGYRGDQVFLNDPAFGHRTVTREEFEADFSGVVLEFEPGPGFERAGREPGFLPGLKRRFAGNQGALALVLGLSLILVAPSLAVPVFSKVYVDKVLVSGYRDWTLPILGAMLLTLALQVCLTWMQQHYILRLQTKLTMVSTTGFIWHVLSLPARFFTQRYAPEITQRCRLNDMLASLLSGQLATSVLNLFLALFYLLALACLDLPLTLPVVAAVALNLAAVRAGGPHRREEYRRLLQESGKADATTTAMLQCMDTVKAQGMEADVFSLWAGYHAGAVDHEQRVGAVSSLMSLAPVFLAGAAQASILGFGAMRILSGAMTLGDLVAYQALALMLLGPVNQLAAMGGTLSDASACLRRLDDVLDHPPDGAGAALPAGDQEVLLGSEEISGELELKDVTFGYSPLDPPLLENFSLRLRPGSRVALVGFSGSGKSTVARLAAGLYRPWNGKVLIDGRPREDYPPFVLKKAVQMVDQNIFLFEGTVRENLTLWDPAQAEETLVKACVDACIFEALASRANGLDTRLEENGKNLSGGQRQCLEIARALAAGPAILILDEATNSLDPVREAAIDFNLRRRGCSCLIVAHRLSTVRDADEIIVMDKGRVLQRGRHDDLMAVAGPYRDLVASGEGGGE